MLLILSLHKFYTLLCVYTERKLDYWGKKNLTAVNVTGLLFHS